MDGRKCGDLEDSIPDYHISLRAVRIVHRSKQQGQGVVRHLR